MRVGVDRSICNIDGWFMLHRPCEALRLHASTSESTTQWGNQVADSSVKFTCNLQSSKRPCCTVNVGDGKLLQLLECDFYFDTEDVRC